jgi:DNA-binding PadR family transcriptional regulator
VLNPRYHPKTDLCQSIARQHLTLTDITRFVIHDRVPRSPAPDPEHLLPLPVATFHILVAVADQDRHGYAIMQDVAARTDGALKLSPGTLYGSIRRMLDEGLIVELSARQRPEKDDERRRYYQITAFGRSVALAEAARLASLLRQAKAVGLAPGRS